MSQSVFAANFRGTSTQIPKNPSLDLDAYVGQRQAAFRFEHVDIVTGYRRTLHPRLDRVPVLSHDTSRSIKRTLTGLWLDKVDTAALNTLSARIEIFMTIGGQDFPLGQYLFNDQTRARFTSGVVSSSALYDNWFIIDQPLEHGFPEKGPSGFDVQGAQELIRLILAGLPIIYTMEPSGFLSSGSWTAGTSRGYAASQLATDGDYLPPWFDNTNVLRFIRSFDPATVPATFDFDAGNKVLMDPPPVEADNLLTAANQFVVISNVSTSNTDTPVVGVYDVPASAPHSAANRGFIIRKTETLQVENTVQAAAIAANLGQRQILFEQIELTTAPDPRHDSYDVIRWQGQNWLETAWSLPLVEGSQMRHVARKAYS